MIIGVNLKTIVKNYSLCEKSFRDDYKVNNYTKGILNFFSNIQFNVDIINDFLLVISFIVNFITVRISFIFLFLLLYLILKRSKYH